MRRWLVKTEPGSYSFDDLVREKRTTWTGVKNAQALIHLRAMRKGDSVFIYHTGVEKSVVGKATVFASNDGDVELHVGAPLWRPVTLAEIKIDSTFANWELVKNSRLSVMPVPDRAWERIEEMSGAAFANTSADGRPARGLGKPKRRAATAVAAERKRKR